MCVIQQPTDLHRCFVHWQGDAVGACVEFCARGSFPRVVAGVVADGKLWSKYPNPHHLKRGQWTDDTSMALCLAESILGSKATTPDPLKALKAYRAWWKTGHLSSNGKCFDIGRQVKAAISRTKWRTSPILAPPADTRIVGGNGGIMRLAPAVLGFLPRASTSGQEARLHAAYAAVASSATTHSTHACTDAAAVLGLLVAGCLSGGGGDGASKLPSAAEVKADLAALRKYAAQRRAAEPELPVSSITFPKALHEHIDGVVRKQKGAGGSVDKGVCGGSRVDQTLEAALWAFATTSSWEEGLLAAVNLGGDTDTVGAVYEQVGTVRV